jgi:hypothetical protein
VLVPVPTRSLSMPATAGSILVQSASKVIGRLVDIQLAISYSSLRLYCRGPIASCTPNFWHAKMSVLYDAIATFSIPKSSFVLINSISSSIGLVSPEDVSDLDTSVRVFFTIMTAGSRMVGRSGCFILRIATTKLMEERMADRSCSLAPKIHMLVAGPGALRIE